jgi:hypothetical protein
LPEEQATSQAHVIPGNETVAVLAGTLNLTVVAPAPSCTDTDRAPHGALLPGA